MWNLDRRVWNQYMQKSNQRHGGKVEEKHNSIAYNRAIHEKRISAESKYEKIPNMQDALLKVRMNKSSLNMGMVNATSSRKS